MPRNYQIMGRCGCIDLTFMLQGHLLCSNGTWRWGYWLFDIMTEWYHYCHYGNNNIKSTFYSNIEKALCAYNGPHCDYQIVLSDLILIGRKWTICILQLVHCLSMGNKLPSQRHEQKKIAKLYFFLISYLVVYAWLCIADFLYMLGYCFPYLGGMGDISHIIKNFL